MKRFAILALVAVVGGAQAQTVWYGGDYDGDGTGFPVVSQHGGANANTLVFDDFNLAGGQTITGLFGNFSDTGTARAAFAYWEIRSGVSEGNGGTLVASGTSGATAVATGRSAQSLAEFTYSISGLSVSGLAAGHYWMAIGLDYSTQSTQAAAQAYLSTTKGTNHIGTPFGNGQSYLNSPLDFGTNFAYTNVGDIFGVGSLDFSYGVQASGVPEPATMAALGLGVVALIKRRRK